MKGASARPRSHLGPELLGTHCRKGRQPRMPLTGHLGCFLSTHPRLLKYQLTQGSEHFSPGCTAS